MLTDTDGKVTIVATTLAALDAEEAGGEATAHFLNVNPPPSWPPQHNDADTREWMRNLLRQHPGEPGYNSWYLIADGELVGTLGYTGPPDDEGAVEIGYAVVDERHRRGYASAGVALLVSRAFADPRVNLVAAHALADGFASQGVLLKAGFTQVGDPVHTDEGPVVRFERKRGT
jgi:[ribosomal protein S5]-alanine N-acetyltransferase